MSLRKKRRQCIPIFLRYQQLMGRQCVDYRDGTNGYQPRSLINKNGYHPAHFGWRSWTPSFGQNGTQRIPSVSTRLPARHALFGRDLETNGYDQAMTMGARPTWPYYGATGFGMPGMQTAPTLRRPIFFAHQHIAGSRNSAALRQFHGYSLGVGGFRFLCLSPRYLFGNYRGCRDDRLLLRRCAARALMHNAEKCRIKYLGSGNPVISAAPVQQNPL